VLRLANLAELRGFLSPGKPGGFARTGWWWTQSGQTGLYWGLQGKYREFCSKMPSYDHFGGRFSA
jgi:hypothetical protein